MHKVMQIIISPTPQSIQTACGQNNTFAYTLTNPWQTFAKALLNGKRNRTNRTLCELEAAETFTMFGRAEVNVKPVSIENALQLTRRLTATETTDKSRQHKLPPKKQINFCQERGMEVMKEI